MTDRILEILRKKNLSPSQFADEIGVQRSSISHLVSGRNKPSLEFIQKLLSRFPDISTEWLLSGTGPMEKDGVKELPASIPTKEDTLITPDLFLMEQMFLLLQQWIPREIMLRSAQKEG